MFLLWLMRLAAVAIVLPSFFMAWYLAGSDDTARNPVAPVLDLGVLVSSVWSVVHSFQVPPLSGRTLLVLGLPFLLALVAWPFSRNRAVPREPLEKYLGSAIWLTAPYLCGLLYAV